MRDGSFKWLTGTRDSFKEEIEEFENSSSGGNNWISELSPVANVVTRRCSR